MFIGRWSRDSRSRPTTTARISCQTASRFRDTAGAGSVIAAVMILAPIIMRGELDKLPPHSPEPHSSVRKPSRIRCATRSMRRMNESRKLECKFQNRRYPSVRKPTSPFPKRAPKVRDTGLVPHLLFARIARIRSEPGVTSRRASSRSDMAGAMAT
jgi:hypothetical protein